MAELGRYAALGIGAFQIFANAVLLSRGFTRLPAELAKEGATGRIADLLRTAWVYGMLGNLCVSVILVLIASPLRAGAPLARQVAILIGLYYVTLRVATYAFAPERHPAFLVFSVLGVLLIAAVTLPG